ncbi:glucose/galactose MFS transporter [Gluconacetobacter diazotrophicus]|uniref:glucose/galactose MFS transporter n=2 Tax=Gluconacetobacter diazotrophicus TaxID=33996 RepID=UPI001199B3CD|nr:glucose/galactose MFS transporter [Gluconacetobacter diazotrophicus]TWB09732.1 hexosaminidase [Gluconacetobacter diazotrophicus]
MTTPSVTSPAGAHGWRPIVIMAILFFSIGFVTWLNGPLITFVQLAFNLSDVAAFLVPACFYLAYFVFPIPATLLARRTGLKAGMAVSLMVMAGGTALFGECVTARWYPGALAGLGVIGAGLSLLQVTINPYVSLLGPHARAAQRIAIMGTANKCAGIVAPLVFAGLVMRDIGGIAAQVRAAPSAAARDAVLARFTHAVHAPYLAMAVLLLGLAVWILRARLPSIAIGREDTADAAGHAEGPARGGVPLLCLGVFSTFLYVGVEVMAGDAIGMYGRGFGLSLDVTKYFTALTLAAMMAGYLAGMAVVPRLVSQLQYMGLSCGLGLVLCGAAWVSSGLVSVLCVALLGFANAMIMPALFPVVMRMMDRHADRAAALLVMAFSGGAVLPQVFVHLAQTRGAHAAFVLVAAPSYLVILAYVGLMRRRTAIAGPGAGGGMAGGVAAAALGAVLAVALPAGHARAAPALMPLPASAHYSGQTLSLANGLAVQWDHAPTPLLRRAADRLRARLDRLAGRVLPADDHASGAAMLRVRYGADPSFLALGEKEQYRLAVRPDGITLDAAGPAGVLDGFATLAQLAAQGPQGPVLMQADIDDRPRFPWRGIMIDVSRHFMRIETLHRQIDAMEQVKLNVLHLHLGDSQGFRVESRLFPGLQRQGSHGQFYTQAQIRDLVAYAADRGVRIVPEFDTPGHALAILLAYPALAAQPVDPAMPDPDDAALNPTLDATLHFVTQLYGEMGRLFPDRYFHAGGDEVQAEQWTRNPKITAFMKAHGFADTASLQAAFTARVQSVLARQGKIMVGWDEVSAAPIPKSVVVEAWRSSKFIGTATRAGHPVVVSAGYYLDLLNPAEQHYRVDPLDVQASGLTRAQADIKRVTMGPLVDAFTLDPTLPPLDAAQQKLVLGGEAPLWSELVTDETLDARLWPRAAAIAERFWSQPEIRDVDGMDRRLTEVASRLEVTGLQARANAYRMQARLAPADPGAVACLMGAVMPVRNYALNSFVRRSGQVRFDELAEIASPDPIAAMRFNALAARFAAGDRGVAEALRAQLGAWAACGDRFATVAQGVGALEQGLPVARDIAALARIGLAALSGPLDDAQRRDAVARIAADQAVVESFAGVVRTHGVKPPPAGLLVAILPGIRSLMG